LPRRSPRGQEILQRGPCLPVLREDIGFTGKTTEVRRPTSQEPKLQYNLTDEASITGVIARFVSRISPKEDQSTELSQRNDLAILWADAQFLISLPWYQFSHISGTGNMGISAPRIAQPRAA